MPNQRRHNTRRRSRARFNGLYKVISAALILMAVVVACLLFFRVDQVVIQGNRRYSDSQIMEVAGVKRGDNLFRVDRGKVVRALQARLPYIQSVSVRKLLPDTLSITVTEGRAAAAVPHDGTWWLMGSDGKLLEEAEDPGDYPVVTGVSPLAPAVGTFLAAGEEQQSRVSRLQELLAGLEETGLMDGLQRVDLSADYETVFVYKDRFTVRLGSAMEAGTLHWLRLFAEAVKNPAVDANQSYTVDITDGEHLRFIPA